MLKSRIVASPDWPERLRAEWTELVDHSPTSTILQTWEWQSSWWKFYRGTTRPHILALYEGKDLVGLMPMTMTRGLWRAVKPMGKGRSCYMHPIARESYEEQVGESFAEYLVAAKGIDYIDLSMIRDTEPVLKYLKGGTVYGQYPCYSLELPATFEVFVGTLPGNLRYDLKRFARSESETGGPKIKVLGGEEVSSGMELLFELSNRRWQNRGPAALFSEAPARDLYRSWAELAQARGWLRLSTITIDGAPIAVLMAVRLGGSCYFQMHGFQPEHKSIAPGTVLIGDAIRYSIESGCEWFDFMMGDEAYKRRWGPQRMSQLVGWKYVPPGLRGQLADKGYGLGVSAKSRLQKLRRGLRRH